MRSIGEATGSKLASLGRSIAGLVRLLCQGMVLLLICACLLAAIAPADTVSSSNSSVEGAWPLQVLVRSTVESEGEARIQARMEEAGVGPCTVQERGGNRWVCSRPYAGAENLAQALLAVRADYPQAYAAEQCPPYAMRSTVIEFASMNDDMPDAERLDMIRHYLEMLEERELLQWEAAPRFNWEKNAVWFPQERRLVFFAPVVYISGVNWLLGVIDKS